MHKLLFYLIHDYAGVTDIDQLAVKETLNDITPLSNEIEREMPQVYFPAVDWRMFIPPLPVHSGALLRHLDKLSKFFFFIINFLLVAIFSVT